MSIELKTITGMASLFDRTALSGRSVVVSIIIRDTNIVKNTIFVPVFRKDYISGLSISTRKRKSIVFNEL